MHSIKTTGDHVLRTALALPVMASNLYETLEVPKDAEPEQSACSPLSLSPSLIPHLPVRKAYKKKALKTHPDRLPREATQEEKAASEEMFRMVRRCRCLQNQH